MILALLIYLGAHTGTIVATPSVINAMAVGAVVTEAGAYCNGAGGCTVTGSVKKGK